mmetsp:Transcript_142445/g.354996  ORF Transcript_142445/g.354996 Transcript_142445/m.354996 type:complete len:265 (-) Transcript_142445:1162-1956(-)
MHHLRPGLICDPRAREWWSHGRQAATSGHLPDHLHELLEVDLAIRVRVDGLEDVFQLLVKRLSHLLLLENFQDFVLTDLAVPALVKDTECCPTNVLLLIQLLVQCCRQELRVINGAALIAICLVVDFLQVTRYLLQTHFAHALAQLLSGEHTVVVGVQGLKSLPQGSDLALTHLVRDHLQRNPLDLAHEVEVAQVCDDASSPARLRLRGLVLDPRMLHGGRGREPRLRVPLHQLAHELLRLARHVVPERVEEAVLALQDILLNL